MLSIDHRLTYLQRYSKEPLNGSTSRGTAINLQEELDEIAPFRGSINIEGEKSKEEDEDDDKKIKLIEVQEPEFFKFIEINHKLNHSTVN